MIVAQARSPIFYSDYGAPDTVSGRFDKNRRVERLANYGLKDGKVFDFVSRTTPTSGQELTYIGTILNIARF